MKFNWCLCVSGVVVQLMKPRKAKRTQEMTNIFFMEETKHTRVEYAMGSITEDATANYSAADPLRLRKQSLNAIDSRAGIIWLVNHQIERASSRWVADGLRGKANDLDGQTLPANGRNQAKR